MLEAKAEKGGTKEAEALMNLYIYDPPDDLEEGQAHALARKWYEAWIALLKDKAGKGSVRAKKKLAEVLYSGDGIPEELLAEFSDEEDDSAFDESVKLYEQLAAQGDYALGDMYLKGLGVEADLQKAYDYFQKAARYGSRAAENALNSKKFHLGTLAGTAGIYTAHRLNLQYNLTADRQPGTFPEASL